MAHRMRDLRGYRMGAGPDVSGRRDLQSTSAAHGARLHEALCLSRVERDVCEASGRRHSVTEWKHAQAGNP